MLYMAFTKEKTVIYARDAVGKVGPFYCPKCHQEVVVKRSSKGVLFFSHVNKKGSKTNESDKHKLAKEQLSHWLQQANLLYGPEIYLKDIQQYPDLLVEYPTKSQQWWCIEFQRSRLTAKELDQRQKGYEEQQLYAQWLLDDETVNTTIPKWHFNFVQFHPQLGFYLIYYNVTSDKMILRHHLPIIWQSGKIPYQMKGITLSHSTTGCLFNDFTGIDQLKEPLIGELAHTPKDSYFLESLKSTPNNRSYLNDFYRLGYSIEDLPHWVWDIQSRSWLFKEPIWYILGRLIYEAKASTFESVYRHLIDTNQINYCHLPLTNREWQGNVCDELKKLLIKNQ